MTFHLLKLRSIGVCVAGRVSELPSTPRRQHVVWGGSGEFRHCCELFHDVIDRVGRTCQHPDPLTFFQSR
jgi:hypothetical protein